MFQLIGSLFFRHFLAHPLGILDGALPQVFTLDALQNIDVDERAHSKKTGCGECNFGCSRHFLGVLNTIDVMGVCFTVFAAFNNPQIW